MQALPQERDALKGPTGLLVLLAKDQPPIPELEKFLSGLQDALQQQPGLKLVPDKKIKNILVGDRPDESLKEDPDAWKKSINDAVFTESDSNDPDALTNIQRLNILKKLLSDLERTEAGVARWKMQELATCYVAMVQCWMIQFREKGAPTKTEWMENYIKILRTRPDFQLIDSSSSQELDILEKARAKIKAMKKGKLFIESTPADAEVLLDVVLVGKTPFQGGFIPRVNRGRS